MDTHESGISDEELAIACSSGNDAALAVLIDRYMPSVYNYARRMCGNDTEAQDIAQDALVKVWINIKKFNNERASFKTWLWRIVRNTTFDSLRKHAHAHTPFSNFDTEEGNTIIDTASDELPMQDELFAQAEDAEMLEKALQKLSPPARDMLLLRYKESMTFEEIGATLGEPTNTVKSRHRRALESLRKLIQD